MGIGDVWDSITEGISTVWDTVMELPEQFSGFFTDVNMFGWLILSIIAEVCLWGFWYYTVYVQEVTSFLDMKTMIIGTVVSPIIAYVFAWRASKQ